MARKKRDRLLEGLTYAASAVGVFFLGAIVYFVLSRGLGLINVKLFTGDYNVYAQTLRLEEAVTTTFTKPATLDNNTYFSKKYGVAFTDGFDLEGKPEVTITYVAPASPFKAMKNMTDKTMTSVEADMILDQFIIARDQETAETIYIYIRQGAQVIAEQLDRSDWIESMQVVSRGGGIRGSIITTLWLVALTLLIAMPLGIFTALYLHEVAPKNKITAVMRQFVDILTGIPSIIFGLMGASFFVPLVIRIFGENRVSGGSLISGALTLAVIVLPVIIKAVEAALEVVPDSYRQGSLALGATKMQTTFKVILPNAFPGILSGGLLAIGRIIGESAALIYAVGTVIKDDISIFGNGTSLAVHIWTVMAGEVPNVDLAASIALVILLVVLMLNVLVKVITNRFMRRFQG